MSEARDRRKVIKALRRTPAAYFDLVRYLRDRRYAGTKRQARALILAGKVKSDSHTLGIGKGIEFDRETGEFKQIDIVLPHVPVELKRNVTVDAERFAPGRRIVVEMPEKPKPSKPASEPIVAQYEAVSEAA